MSYIDDDVKEGRRCAGIITALASQLDGLVEGEVCELCPTLEAFSQKLSILAGDLLESTETYAKTDGAPHSLNDGKKGS